MIKIYLAGPDVFRSNAIEHFEILKQICKKYGFIGLVPLDNVIEIPEKDKFTPIHSHFIFKANVDLIKECDVIIANLLPFRGACVDDGTAWELGCGYAYGKKLYGYSLSCDMSLKEITKMMFEIRTQNMFTEVENFGNPVNLMLVNSIKELGGNIFKTFEECVKNLHDELQSEELQKKFDAWDEPFPAHLFIGK